MVQPAASGFDFTEEILGKFNAVMKRDCKWVVCQIPEGKDAGCCMSACGEKASSDNEADFAAFAAAFPDDQPRWGIYDLNFEKGGVNNNKVVFVNYVPDDCPKN